MVYYNEYTKFYYLKKVTQILLSISIFSYIFSQSSSLVPHILVHSYDYIVSNYSIKIFTYKTERNYIFLLCNGILVLIIQTSGLISKITTVQSCSKSYKIDDHHDEPKRPDIITRKVEVFEEKGKENGCDEEKCGVVDNLSFEIEEWEEEDDEGLSTDELNKKCEDFIKKMKQEIQG